MAAPFVQAQASSANTALERHLERMDLGLNGNVNITRTVSGTNAEPVPGGQLLTHEQGTTAGALVQLRYTRSPWIGAEFNIGYARFTHRFSTPDPHASYLNFNVQTNAMDFTLGYLAHPAHQFAGLQPFFGGGGGLMYFHTTSGGGQGFPNQGAGAFYYTAGVDRSIVPHLGVRAQVRQLFYLSPDFYKNFLTTEKHTSTLEPTIGFYIHY